MTNEEYDLILEKSKEFLAAKKGLGPYIGFGLSYIQGTLTMAIGKWSFDIFTRQSDIFNKFIFISTFFTLL